MSEKNRDAKNRWRTVTVAFRLSPEENEELIFIWMKRRHMCI